ncbi:hypothetical protein PGT21_005689 [Puccinia graminis f. sp. tritici]|uniref:hAT-like transposase RNase-H fold domain-containing protein n=1 Tax=Puccinia graminis f. sp. tritici TaxID=56615 RepID=A0A5B0LMP6_PUCGR|nr:hypothetical protein PGT21_005689 [Puccinia graminis f. sp. tritici]KAA1080048.1 hypothetical protein PGTUg99_024853 [Puccinia graminis f. sp. tritici]
MALPIYISLIKTIYGVRSQYNSAQLITAADEMVNKLTKYLLLALEKPAPICAMILDPRIKLSYFEKNKSFFLEHKIPDMTPENALAIFKSEAKSFDRSPSRTGKPTLTQKNDKFKAKTKAVKARKLTSIKDGLAVPVGRYPGPVGGIAVISGANSDASKSTETEMGY